MRWVKTSLLHKPPHRVKVGFIEGDRPSIRLHHWYKNQLEVAPLKNLFFLVVLKLDIKDSSGYNKGIKRMGKTFPTIWTYKHCLTCILKHYLPSMYFRVNLKAKKPMLCCVTWIVFIELNFTVAFLFKRKTWGDRFACKGEEWGILRHGGWFWNGELIPL